MTNAPVPILLVGGFLGAGKTTVVNHLLAHAGARRISAIVNDFGAINIDAALIAGADGAVMSLANGCICCSLQGDLLRTLAIVLRRDPRPDAIVIETSGVADPREIARNLMDPVIWKEAPLETVLCVADATTPPERFREDALLRAGIGAADLIALSKVDLIDAPALTRVRDAIRACRPAIAVVETTDGAVPIELLFPEIPTPRERTLGTSSRRRLIADRFETHSWTSPRPLSLLRFRKAIDALATRLVRAKGLLEAVERPGGRFVFQFAGGRATLAPSTVPVSGSARTRLVFIAELGTLSTAEINAVMSECCSGSADPSPASGLPSSNPLS